MCAPAWDAIDKMPKEQAELETALRCVYSSALINGPMSVLLGSHEGVMAINDRLKLRALMAGEKGSMVYLASEQAAIELVCPDIENVRAIEGGVPFVVQLDSVAKEKALAAAENEPAEALPHVMATGVAPASYKRREE